MRIVALACGALGLLNGCRADVVTDVPPARGAVASVDVPAVAAATTPTSPATTTATDARAEAETVAADPGTTPASAATQETPREGPPVGCVDTVAALPEVAFVRRDDRRLQRERLIVVAKSARRLMLFERGTQIGCWRVALGFAPEGHKMVQGDGKTPEGWYRTSDKPWSSFDDAIAIHYPNADDARAAAADGRIGKRTRDAIVGAIEGGKVPPQATKLGGAVLIHGGGSSFDWTLGCVALDDAELLALRDRLPKGMRTDMLILP